MRGYFTWAQARDRELHYRPHIDGLRGIAILAVLGFHAFPKYIPGGYVGVDVFFVISGFLISTIILKQLRRRTFTLADFYIRRARRLFPALAIVLVSCLLFGWFALLPQEFENLGKHVAAAAAFVLNLTVWREGGYFDPAANLNPMLHLWSLGIEEQFYLVWPLVLLLLSRRRRSLVTTIGVLVASSFALNIVFMHTDPKGAFYLPVTRFWELGLGCLLAALAEAQPASAEALAAGEGGRPAARATTQTGGAVLSGWRLAATLGDFPARWLHPALSVLGFVLICAAALLFDNRMAFPGWAALLPAAGAMCIIRATHDSWFQGNVLSCRPLVFVGAISYPLYLWHWPLLSFATILGSGVVPTAVRVAAIVLSFVLAFLVFRFVELPVRSWPAARASGGLAAGLGTLGIAGLAIFAAAGLSHRFGHDVRALQTASRVNHFCLQTFPGHRDFNFCKGTSAAPPEVIFLGDSRAQAVYEGVAAMTHNRYSMMLLARGGCPPVLHVRTRERAKREVSCDATWSGFVRDVRKLAPRIVVVVGGGSNYVGQSGVRYAGQPGSTAAGELPFGELAFKEGLSDLIAALQASTSVIYMREAPSFDTPPTCFMRPIKVPWGACAPVMARATIEQRMAAYNEVVDEIELRFPRLMVVDSIPALCGSKYCAQRLRSGEILYRDPLHLTAAGARHLDKGSGLSGLLNRNIHVP
ncbi:MAG: acyltransferase family protein [Steroidobacteraceae bacterium]